MPFLTQVPGYIKGTMYMVDWPLPWPQNKTPLKSFSHPHSLRIITIIHKLH
jgi:hypothetical protein